MSGGLRKSSLRTNNAAELKADAVINVVCKSGEFSLTKNCMQYFQCTGDGITWN
jgi:uncharacterized protein YbjQ (UPF0145 family)